MFAFIHTVLKIGFGQPDVAIDTGTSLIGAPADALKTILAVVPGSQLIKAAIFKGSVPRKTKVNIAV